MREDATLYPLVFEPILKRRVWGGHRIRQLFGRGTAELDAVGESWEISDRPEGISRITNGELEGVTLRSLLEHRREEVMGITPAPKGRFPWLCKILDASEP